MKETKIFISEDAQIPHKRNCCVYPNGLGVCGCTCHIVENSLPHTSKEEEIREKWENQSFIKVLKQASDFSEEQYELVTRLLIPFVQNEVSEALTEQKMKFREMVAIMPTLEHPGHYGDKHISRARILSELTNL